jgi:hypothetical protein
MSGFKNIPKDWACCENGFDGSQSNDEIGHIQWFEARNSDFQFCIHCILKWQKFNFDPNLNYDQFDELE